MNIHQLKTKNTKEVRDALENLLGIKFGGDPVFKDHADFLIISNYKWTEPNPPHYYVNDIEGNDLLSKWDFIQKIIEFKKNEKSKVLEVGDKNITFSKFWYAEDFDKLTGTGLFDTVLGIFQENVVLECAGFIYYSKLEYWVKD